MQPPEQRDEVEMLSLMLLIRRFEERASQQYQAQKIGGFCHLYIGQEAVVAGAVAAARPDDYLITAYRDHAHALARGTSANACMAELFGKATGCSRGLGGSMHYFDKEHHMYGGHAIVAAHVPLAVGMAFASKYRDEDRVTLCFFGDGAINQGAFHEALNLAGLYKLPIVFICENNLFAMGTSVEALDVAQGNRRSRGRLRHPGDGDRRNEFSRSARQSWPRSSPRFARIRTLRSRKFERIVIAVIPCRTPRAIAQRNSSKNSGWTIRSRDCARSSHAKEKLTNEQFDKMDKEAKETALASVKFAEESPEPPLEKLYDYTTCNGASA